ncbi:MAG: D-glycero-beta-D-manno-heptose 1-phosphate adenylyltransferase [Ktedonobacteraceae bacterium]|nr:D-glycero-beta-D-manno-heptose 1-phosphate adenylyltransferase [Ktedonobacteraceae bacterium]
MLSSSMIELIQRFRQQRVLVIGDAMLDTYLAGEATRLCSEGPVPVVRKTTEQHIPGGAANTAANLAALEAHVDFLSAIGRDRAGSVLRSELCKHGINDQWLVEDETASTLHKLRILANDQYVVRFDEGGLRGSHLSPYTSTSQQQISAHLDELYTQCDVIIISDYDYGIISDELITQLCALCAAQPKVILVDSKALQRFHQLPMTAITPNFQEARLLIRKMADYYDACEPDGYHGSKDQFVSLSNSPSAHQSLPSTFDPNNLAHVEHLARHLLATLSTEHVAITLAEHGVLLLDRHEHILHIPAYPVVHANDVGAGDSFIAVLALALAAGGTIEEAAHIATNAAEISVSKQGTATVQYHELLQQVSLRVYTSQAHALTAQNALASLTAQLEVERILGHTIVFTNGVFDILHAGHVQFLRQAKALGDVLVVAVNSDASTHRQKGAGRPINSERDRMALVAALDMVDHVLLFDEDTPIALIQTLRPHVHVKGGDYANQPLPEEAAVHAAGGRVVILPLVGTISTSSVIERIVEIALKK